MKTTLKLAGLSLAFAIGMSGVASSKELRLSHQWSTKDVRHKVAQIVADEVAAADVGLEIKIFPSKSLFKPREQYKPLSRGQLDMTVFPLAYAAGQRPEYNLTLMPGLVKNHDHAARLNESDFMGDLEKLMAEDDTMVLVHGYLAGGFVGTDRCITSPDHVKVCRHVPPVSLLSRCWQQRVHRLHPWHHLKFITPCKQVFFRQRTPRLLLLCPTAFMSRPNAIHLQAM